MGTPPLIGVSCVRDPLDPSVWSRTPRNICDVMKARGRLGPSFFGLPLTSPLMKVRASLAALRYGRPLAPRRFLHAAALRHAHARHILADMERSGLSHFLHFGADRYLPLPRVLPHTRHYLMMDCTWDYWREPDMPAAYFEAVDRDLRRAYQQMEQLFVLSDFTRTSLVERYGVEDRRITTVGSGRGAIQPYRGPKDYAGPAILFVAKERFAHKGGMLLVEAFRMARKAAPHLRLWLVGDPHLRQFSGEENIEVMGFLPLAELQSLFERAALFAMPAPREPWGLVYLEALSCKTPVLGLDRAGLQDITCKGAYGFLVADPRPDAVAAALLDAFSDLPRLEKMGVEGQKHTLAHYTWERVTDRILERIDAGL